MELDKYGTAGDIQELLAIRDRIDTLLETKSGNEALAPRIDLLDTGDAYRVVIEVPGVPQENLEIALQGKELIVAGIRETSNASDSDEETLIVSERPSGHFQRTLMLPGEVVTGKATAHLREGLLILTIPKS
jgi:HSP20 family protein